MFGQRKKKRFNFIECIQPNPFPLFSEHLSFHQRFVSFFVTVVKKKHLAVNLENRLEEN